MRSWGGIAGVVALAASLAVAAPANAATPGTLDTTFGGSGVFSKSFGSDTCAGFGQAFGVAVQSNGRIVGVGRAAHQPTPCDSGQNDFLVAGVTSGGALDTTFGASAPGSTTTSFASPWNYNDVARGVAIQPDDKIVAVGYVTENTTFERAFGIARYTADGTLDPSFGDCKGSSDALGTTTTTFSGADAVANGVAIQPDGKIVVAGSAEPTSGFYFDFAIARYDTNGCLDTTFGGGTGTELIDFKQGNAFANSVLIQPDGKIVVGGSALNSNGDSDFALARLGTDGTPDNSFGPFGNGTTLTDFQGATAGHANDGINGLALQSDGKIVAAGGAYMGATRGTDFALARYGTDGLLDSSFGSGGEVTTDFAGAGGASDSANAVLLDPAGGIIAGGNSCCQHGNDFALARYNPDGSLDPGFGTGGLTITDMSAVDSGSSGNASGEAAALQSSGGILLAGFDEVPISSGISYHFLVARYFGAAPPIATVPSSVTTSTPPPPTMTVPSSVMTSPGAHIAGLHANTTTFHMGRALAHFSRQGQVGATFSFSLDRAAGVTFAFTKLLAGKRSGRRCVGAKPKLMHARSCTRRVPAGSLSYAATAGPHRLFFDGRLSRRKTLRPGRYELAVTANTDGVTSAASKLLLTLLPPLRR